MIVDELHALATTKRGNLLALGLSRLATMSPNTRFVGLSATVHDPAALADWLALGGRPVETVRVAGGAQPDLSILSPEARVPWGGHMARHTLPDVYQAIRKHRMTIVFVNTRATAEIVFDDLWRMNDDNLPIGLHHGSLEVEQRRKIEAAMAAGRLRAWSPPRRSISVSTGATSTWWCRSARPRASAACCSAWAAPTTAWTSPAGRSSRRATASRCWNASQPWRR